MSGCPGCFSQGRALQAEMETIIAQATEYAKENNTPTAIIKTEEGYQFCDAFYAYQYGLPVLQVVSVN